MGNNKHISTNFASPFAIAKSEGRKANMISSSKLLVSRAVTPVARRWYSHGTVVSGPPRTKIPKWEKGVHALCIFVGGLTIPAWVLMHLKVYRGEVEPSH